MKRSERRVSRWNAWVAAVLAGMLAGCASIVDGGPQTLSIRSNPADATLSVYDLRKGDKILNVGTPFTATLERGAGYFKKARYRVVIEKEGYEPKEVVIEGTATGWYILGNLVFGGLIGWLIVDPATGAMWKLEPSEVNADLLKKAALLPHGQGLVIALTDRLPALPAEVLGQLEPVQVKWQGGR